MCETWNQKASRSVGSQDSWCHIYHRSNDLWSRLPVFISEGFNYFAYMSFFPVTPVRVIFDIAKLVIKGKLKSACLNAFKSWHSQSIPTSTQPPVWALFMVPVWALWFWARPQNYWWGSTTALQKDPIESRDREKSKGPWKKKSSKGDNVGHRNPILRLMDPIELSVKVKVDHVEGRKSPI